MSVLRPDYFIIPCGHEMDMRTFDKTVFPGAFAAAGGNMEERSVR